MTTPQMTMARKLWNILERIDAERDRIKVALREAWKTEDTERAAQLANAESLLSLAGLAAIEVAIEDGDGSLTELWETTNLALAGWVDPKLSSKGQLAAQRMADAMRMIEELGL